jgi:hypothetical protein
MKKYEEWQARLGTTTFDPLDAMTLATAIRERASTVVLNLGTFKLHYKGDKVQYRPIEGFTPTGWIDIERIEREG